MKPLVLFAIAVSVMAWVVIATFFALSKIELSLFVMVTLEFLIWVGLLVFVDQ